jgi:uncharacterized protein YjbI with pentapeptide repeats
MASSIVLVVIILVGYFFSSSFDLSNISLVFLSISVLFQTILSNARFDRSKLDKKEHKVVKSPTAIAGSQVLSLFDLDQLNSVQFRSAVLLKDTQLSRIQLDSAQLSSNFS